MTVRYLSLDWIEAMGRAVAGSTALAELAGTCTIAVTQVVTDTPDGDVTYHLTVGDGVLGFGAGPAEGEDVRLEQSWETARGVAIGEINAQQVFIDGSLRITGDVQKLIANEAVFAALGAVFDGVREETSYD